MLRPNVTLHFEVEDLRNASPATVSRAGHHLRLARRPRLAADGAERGSRRARPPRREQLTQALRPPQRMSTVQPLLDFIGKRVQRLM